MGFMIPVVTEELLWAEIEITDGSTEWVEAEYISFCPVDGRTYSVEDDDWLVIYTAVRDYCEGEPCKVKFILGHGAYMSAPGYLDRTDISVFSTPAEAASHLIECYYNDEPLDEMSGSDRLELQQLEAMAGGSRPFSSPEDDHSEEWEYPEEPPPIDDRAPCRICGAPVSDADYMDNDGRCDDCCAR